MPSPERATQSWTWPQDYRVDPPAAIQQPSVSPAAAWSKNATVGGDRAKLVLALLTQQFPGHPAYLDHRFVWLDIIHDVPMRGLSGPGPAAAGASDTTSAAPSTCWLGEGVTAVDAETGQVVLNAGFSPQTSEPGM